jgi:ribosomal-protein-alanine N-acetyltransferase
MAIELEAYPDPWSEGMFRDELRNPRSHFYVVYLDGLLIGYGGFWLVLDEAHITSVTIREEYRGQGFGKQLVAFLLDKAREVGTRLATLEVRASNDLARNLYLSFGFRPVGVRKNYYPKSGEDAIAMLKEFDE